ncbi:MAG: flagellar basal-body MS-ring/collar protein FliF [Clostridia bacterium]|nr:flagellar basal-body MS-ring/collar protein FliF [Clostridia bacterium]MDD4048297.1 flagellar basal-body MS-ring/collar protein FliF [Clostridia bacterium]
MGLGAQLREQTNNIWKKMPIKQKGMFASIIVISLLIVLGIIFVQKPKMEVLYSNLEPQDASAITAKLKEEKINYQLTENGKAILVNGEDVYQLRLDMAGQVDLKGVVGFESFNETKFGETDTDKRVRFLVALQGELTRTIEELDGVESAKVHIALPQPSLFIRDEKDATASVLLRLKAYANLDSDKVKSIMCFVSHSVEGLKLENVTVMDVNGNLLSEGVEDGESYSASRISANQLALKQEYEKEYARSIQSMLEKMKGSGKAVVRSNISMDFDKVEKHSEIYGEPILVSEQVKEESSKGSSGQSGENPADANMIGPSYGNVGGSDESEYQLTERTRNYDFSKTVENKVIAPGKITMVSLSVIIDGELTPEEENKIKDAVAMAGGIDMDRGDQISVIGMAFNNADVSKMKEELAQRETSQRRMEYLRIAIKPLIAVLIIGAIIFMIRRSPAYFKELGINTGGRSQEIAAVNDDGVSENELNLSEKALERKATQVQIEKLVDKNSKEVADVVKTWLLEEQR